MGIARDHATRRPPFVVAISSVSGGGKTTLAQKAGELLDASTLSFDDYRATSDYPEDVLNWIEQGADLNDWKTPEFAKALLALKNGENVQSPINGLEIEPTEFILIEEPMGRGRAEMAASIDFVALIDTPLEIALARRLLRATETVSLDRIDDAPKQRLIDGIVTLVEYLRSELQEYLDGGRALYVAAQKQVEADCDLILDGRLPADELAEKLVDAVKCARDSK